MTDLILVRVNCPDRDTADLLSRKAIEARLAACTNLSGPVTASYVWEGRVERDEEYVLVLKARATAWAALRDLVRQHHPFDTPAILALPVIEAEPGYAAWLVDNTDP